MVEDTHTSRPPSPAETLRRAATEIRRDQKVEESLGHIGVFHYDAWLAVADWLDSTANDVEHVHTPVYNLTSTTVARALAVARAYLGESA